MSPFAPTSFDIVVVAGLDAGAHAVLDSATGKLLVGDRPGLRSSASPDPSVSRRHASIELTDHGLLVTDLGSTNGSFFGEARIVAAYLSPDVRLQVGGTTIEARSVDAAPAKHRRAHSLGRMASTSPRMMNVLSLCEKLAVTDVPIVLEGETGTGKELLAECIHEASSRASEPFIVLDCRTTPRGLVRSPAPVRRDPPRWSGPHGHLRTGQRRDVAPR